MQLLSSKETVNTSTGRASVMVELAVRIGIMLSLHRTRYCHVGTVVRQHFKVQQQRSAQSVLGDSNRTVLICILHHILSCIADSL